MTKAETGEVQADGRRARGHENRRKIVEAMLALIGSGTISPRAEEVAARAEVGLRTVFRHFDDMDSLYQEISASMSAELLPIATAPLPEGDWRVRLGELIERRARVFEKMMPFKIAADVHRHRSDFLQAEHDELARFQRDTLRGALGPRLCRNVLRLETIDLLMSFDAWRRMRLDQKLTVVQCKKLLTSAIAALLENDDE
ncbi:MAG: TetR/AcrR family transcriptional regulator [Parvibaculum sp.]|nr:TetR/AcrR family transcriptional regulator [Parvibaculum sp.]